MNKGLNEVNNEWCFMCSYLICITSFSLSENS